MTRFLIVILAISVAGFALGCSGSGDSASTDDSADAKVADMAKDAVNSATNAAPLHAEVGCAMCIYKLEGADTCSPAVSVGGKTMMLTGVDIDTHGSGLCSAAKHAHVKGSIEDGKFVATSLDIGGH